MEEIRKIPPVTRTLIGSTLAVTVPCLLAITTPYKFALFYPAIVKKWEVYRFVTSFLYGGQGLSLLFDLFYLYRNSSDLELNHFGRRTADYTWSLIVMATVILATNYPLQSPILFSPMMNALIYIWSRANIHQSVSFFGMINIPAKFLPYAYLFIDLLRGGMPLVIQSATGLLAGYSYWMLAEVLPGRPGGRRWIPTPGFLHRLLPDSLDPAMAGQNIGDRQGRRVAGGTAWNARGGNRVGDGSSSSRTAASAPSSIAAALGATTSRMNPFTGWSSRSGSNDSRRAPTREELLAATERRLRESQTSSIIGRNAAESRANRSSASTSTPTARAGSGTIGSTGFNRNPQTSTPSVPSSATTGGGEAGGTSNLLRRTAAGVGRSNMFTFGQLARDNGEDDDQQPEEDHSSSGGAVAEQRRPNNNDKGKGKEASNSSSTTHSGGGSGYAWGGGPGRRLGE